VLRAIGEGRSCLKDAETISDTEPVEDGRKGFATHTLPIPAVLVDDVKAHLRNHTQLGRDALLFWRTKGGEPVRSPDWLRFFKRACRKWHGR